MIFAGVLCLATTSFSQHQLTALEKVREIKLLQADRDTVRSFLRDFKANETSDSYDEFSAAGATIEVEYSDENCEDDDDTLWDVPEGRVVRIEVVPENDFRLADLGIAANGLFKEQIYSDRAEAFVYHDKKKGIAIEVDNAVIKRFILFPALAEKPRTCKNKWAKEFVSTQSWFGKQKLKDRVMIVCYVSDVTELKLESELLDEMRITREIKISTTVNNPNNDVLTYMYIVSVGKIVGEGPDVVWDLKGVKPGSYTITAGVDDGGGVRGQTKTKTVVIK